MAKKSTESIRSKRKAIMKRRAFLKATALGAAGVALAGGCATADAGKAAAGKRIAVADTGCEFEREPLLRPFGFKAGI
jgi:nitrous oxide reductase